MERWSESEPRPAAASAYSLAGMPAPYSEIRENAVQSLSVNIDIRRCTVVTLPSPLAAEIFRAPASSFLSRGEKSPSDSFTLLPIPSLLLSRSSRSR